MIRLGLRFTLRGGREAAMRLVLTATGIAVASTLLLLILAGFAALEQRDVRKGWLNTSVHNRMPSVSESSTDGLLWKFSGDFFRGDPILRVDVAALGPQTPVLPGLRRLPGQGEYLVSPALADALARTSPALLGERFPGRQVGLLPDSLLTSPGDLVIVAGRRPAALRDAEGVSVVHSIETAPQEHTYTTAMQILLGLGVVGLLVPILVFVSTATRLAAARREERFAAMRLVGATPGQVAAIAAVDSGVAAVFGVAIGFGLFWLLRPLVARLPLTGQPFFVSDLHVSVPVLVAVFLGVPLAAIAATLLTLRRVRISPLGVVGHARRRPPRAWRLFPLAIGFIALVAVALGGGVVGNTGVAVTVALFALLIVGLMIAGPWLTMHSARLLSRVARRDTTLIAARRLSYDPDGAFRAISGLIVAVFIGTVFLGAGSAAETRYASEADKTLPDHAFWVQSSDTDDLPQSVFGLAQRLRDIPGVTEVALSSRRDAPEGWNGQTPLAQASPGDRVRALYIATNGSAAAVERVRTLVETDLPGVAPPLTTAEMNAAGWQLFRLLQHMVQAGIVITLVIAGCSLAVCTAGGLVERKRPFAMLRLAGMPLSRLRRTVLLEAAVPLVLATVASIGAGLAAASLIVNIGRSTAMPWPSLDYYALIAGGVAGALLLVAATLPLLGRLTEPVTLRME